MQGIKVLAIPGSLRKDSFNRKALHIAKQIASATEASVEEADLKVLALPVYDGDIEAEGMPEQVIRFKAMVEAADVLLIASPEYNRSVPGALKNAIDWLSRGRNSLDGKIAAIFGASPGAFGTISAQHHLRQILVALNVLVIPQPQVTIMRAHEAFAPDGSFKDPKTTALLEALVERALSLGERLKPTGSA
jgi:chromate reductase, NAD(P)H dehydrogenase (quinone)